MACGCGGVTSAKTGQCAICAGATERGFCPDCFNDLHHNEAERSMDCWICKKSYYLAAGQVIRPHPSPAADEERDGGPATTAENVQTQNIGEDAMKGLRKKPKRKYTRRAKTELGEHVAPIPAIQPVDEPDAVEALMEEYVAICKRTDELRCLIREALK